MPVNIDQQSNIDAMVRATAESLFSAWSYLHILKGFHEGSKAHPAVVRRFDRLFDQIWRAVFDGLFAKAGTLIDRTKGTYSLPNLVTMARRYGEDELKRVAKQVEVRLSADDGPTAKIESWRHEAVAHRTPNGHAETFFVDNKMNLSEVEEGLRQLEALLNSISMAALKVIHDTGSGSENLIQHGTELFGFIEKQLGEIAANKFDA